MRTARVIVVVMCVCEVELESACLSGQVRPPLYSFDSTQPLSCLGSSVVRNTDWMRIQSGFASMRIEVN